MQGKGGGAAGARPETAHRGIARPSGHRGDGRPATADGGHGAPPPQQQQGAGGGAGAARQGRRRPARGPRPATAMTGGSGGV